MIRRRFVHLEGGRSVRVRSRRLFHLPVAVVLLAIGAGARGAAAQQPDTSIVGRWDLTVRSATESYPSWLEITRSGRSALVGRFQGRVGNVRPIGRVEVAAGTFGFAIPPQWEEGEEDLRLEGRRTPGGLAGTIVTPSGERHAWTATRAPALERTAPPEWGEPVSLFNGRDLTGWRPDPAGADNHWRAVNGVLTNTGSGANLVTTAEFVDFTLRLDVRYPPGGNSGVYLRGRYEVQVEDNGGMEPTPMSIGGVYGFLEASERPGTRPGEWNTYEITLVGRRVTVVLNGKTLIADRIIPGITGGALNSDEASPGPIMLQGDHGPVEYRAITITPARSPR